MQKMMLTMGLALGLPSTIVGVFFLLNQLVKAGYISWNMLLGILLGVIGYILFFMVRNVLVKKNKK
ncbi:MAG: hypothetical protein ACJ76H_07535 [Bacteriovoracaceae bacterium]